MSTTVLKNNEALIPFLGDKLSFITGQDPLGLQNASSQTYSFLLPGLNNVTGRIRYYSFYCWLLTEYAHIIKDTDPSNQRQFIRRAEYIVALVTAEKSFPSVPGIAYARTSVNEGHAFFDLQKGTYNKDGTTENTYWQFYWGIFGQYYAGALKEIGLIEEPRDEDGKPLAIYRRTATADGKKVSGEKLAEAFLNNISANSKEIFLNAIKLGKIAKIDLTKIAADFNLTKVDTNTSEWKLLIQLLLQIDKPSLHKQNPTLMRKDTIAHLLRFAEDTPSLSNPHDFTKYAYYTKGYVNGESNLSLTGWYYYQLNEFWQYACTSILNGCLDYLEELEKENGVSIVFFIENIRDKIIPDLKKIKGYNSKLILFNDPQEEEELLIGIEKNISTVRISFGFRLLWKLYRNNHDQFMALTEFSKSHAIADTNDVISFYAIERWKKKTLTEFIYDFIAERILYRHQFVAYSKMGSGYQTTQKFVFEENLIRRIGNFDPAFTGPRVGNLIQYLKDLNILDVTNKPTHLAKKMF